MIKKEIKNTVKELYKTATPFILLLLMAIVVFCLKSCKAADITIPEYENTIQQNTEQINYFKSIQDQLHITAELLRQEPNPDASFIDGLSQKWHQYESQISDLQTKNSIAQSKIDDILEKQNSLVLIGYFEVSHYDICYNCTGKRPGDKGYGLTATGTLATPGRTVAVDPKIIPYGTELIIGNESFIAEDTGGAIRGYKLDICVSSDAEARKKGRLYNVPVYVRRGQL